MRNVITCGPAGAMGFTAGPFCRLAPLAPAGQDRVFCEKLRRMRSVLSGSSLGLVAAIALAPALAWAWDPVILTADPLVRMPGTQPDPGIAIEPASACMNCHSGYNPAIEPAFLWKGSMMGQAARDFFFWSAMTVAAQDSIWALGTPNAADICERCHMPKGWLELRSDPPNGSAMNGSDFDGVQCDFCHRMVDPFFTDTHSGVREGSDWMGYWDETGLGPMPSQMSADMTLAADITVASGISLFNGEAFYTPANQPMSPAYTESSNGQYFVSKSPEKRGSFADASALHPMLYSRFHKSKFYCATCHDVSNPALANQAFKDAMPGDGSTVLPTEEKAGHSYFHVERTFSEFMLSDYGLPDGSPGTGPFAPGVFTTSQPGNVIASCQDCHMPDSSGVAAKVFGAVDRPSGSAEHPSSGQPLHDLSGGNALVPFILASTVPGSPNYDPVNEQLLDQGPGVLTLDLKAGVGLDPIALLAGRNRALAQLQRAATLENLTYDAQSGAISFRVQNHTGHKLISGYPEGRRMFLNIKLYQKGGLLYELNPYDAAAGTLKGLNPADSPNSPPLDPNEGYYDDLVYEVHMASALTAEEKTFHFVLATGRAKDNRIPPKGFRVAEAPARMAEPVALGVPAPELFTVAEYAGGFDDVSLALPAGADAVEVRLYYQTTSREYVEFLRDEINGTGQSLVSPTPSGEPNAYIVQTDPFFAQLKPWGDTIWQLWLHNKDVLGAAPVQMAQANLLIADACANPPAPDGAPCTDGDACSTGDACSGGVCVGGPAPACDDGNVCTDDGCDSVTGCSHTPNAAPCDDGNVCTKDEKCAFGVCAGLPIICSDNDKCTTDSCDPASGCFFTPIPGCGGAGGQGGAGGAGGQGEGGGGQGGEGGGQGGQGGGQGGDGGSTPAPPEEGGCGCHVPGSSSGLSAGFGAAVLLMGSAARFFRRRHFTPRERRAP